MAKPKTHPDVTALMEIVLDTQQPNMADEYIRLYQLKQALEAQIKRHKRAIKTHYRIHRHGHVVGSQFDLTISSALVRRLTMKAVSRFMTPSQINQCVNTTSSERWTIIGKPKPTPKKETPCNSLLSLLSKN